MNAAPVAGLKYVLRKGKCTINGNEVTISIKIGKLDISCGHTIGHMDNQCLHAEVLQEFDKAIGGEQEKRGWQFVSFPVWYFTRVSTDIHRGMAGERIGRKRQRLPVPKPESWARIARTNADCHGNVVDGTELQEGLDAASHTAASFGAQQENCHLVVKALSDIDELLGKKTNFLRGYHRACGRIDDDKQMDEDYFFSMTKSVDVHAPEYSSIHHNYHRPITTLGEDSEALRDTKYTSEVVLLSEMSERMFKRLLFFVKVYVTQRLRNDKLVAFSDLGGAVSLKFALSKSCAYGMICRVVPRCHVISVKQCGFAEGEEIDGAGKVVVDDEITLRDLFLGEEKIYGKKLDDRRVLCCGAKVDNVRMIIERRESLHVSEIVEGGREDLNDDDGSRVLQRAEDLIVGWCADSSEVMWRKSKLSRLSREDIRDVATKSSNISRAIRILCGRSGLLVSRTDGVRISSPQGEEKCIVFNKSLIRTALVGGMCENDDVKRVEKVLQSIHGNLWTSKVGKIMREICQKKQQLSSRSDSSLTVTVSVEGHGIIPGRHVYPQRDYTVIDHDITIDDGEDKVALKVKDQAGAAAAVKAGLALGMKIETSDRQTDREDREDRKDRDHEDCDDKMVVMISDAEWITNMMFVYREGFRFSAEDLQ